MAIVYRQLKRGITQTSLNNLDKLTRCGNIYSISAIRKEIKHRPHREYYLDPTEGYKVKKEYGTFWCKDELVEVIGTNGTAIYSGFCWGYGGEGPRGLKQMLLQAGVPEELAHKAAHLTIRHDMCGTDWRLERTDGCNWKLLELK